MLYQDVTCWVSAAGLRGGKTVAACVTGWAERWEDSGSLCHKVG